MSSAIKYTYYPGCTSETTAVEFGLSTEAVCEALGIELIELEDWNCCGASSAHTLDHELGFALPGRNVALAQEAGLDMLIPCPACYQHCRDADLRLREDHAWRSRMERILDFQYEGAGRARHHYMWTGKSECFIEWVKASKVRTELLQRADSNFDFDAADELLSTWKERTQASTNSQEVVEKDRGQQRKAASSGSAKGTGESKSKKIYRRSDIINLMQNNPARYLELSDELTQAYSEGRVR